MKKKEVGSEAEPADRVVRGGSWANTAGRARAAYRGWYYPGLRYDVLGLRLVRSMEDTWEKD